MLPAGLFLSGRLGGGRLVPKIRTLHLSGHPPGAPLKPGFDRTCEYSERWV
jgi:glycerol-3-phosphate dehydrogenase